MCCSEWTCGKEVRGHRATSATSHTPTVYIHTGAPFHRFSSRWPVLPRLTRSRSPFVIIAECFVKTFQRSRTSSAFRKINVLFKPNHLTQLKKKNKCMEYIKSNTYTKEKMRIFMVFVLQYHAGTCNSRKRLRIHINFRLDLTLTLYSFKDVYISEITYRRKRNSFSFTLAL